MIILTNVVISISSIVLTTYLTVFQFAFRCTNKSYLSVINMFFVTKNGLKNTNLLTKNGHANYFLKLAAALSTW